MTDYTKKYGEKIYAGVLGKIIGVYLGRPVEGWAYEKIRSTFGDVSYYKHEECGVPLIVADDDISGTFAFFRALEDFGYRRDLSAADIGKTWQNYIIEDKTILWWGGLGRSTEHTAFLNLKRGIPAPDSGSIAVNGQTLAEQIGAQIFMDAFAMACPEDPELAVTLVKQAASVSHDGLAVEAAGYLAAMEAMAFGERHLERLMEDGLRFVRDPRLLSLIDDIRSICAKASDWRRVRNLLDDKYGYHLYPGCCHMVPNHAMVLASLILGGDDFQSSISIASSAGWDTDCNAGNVGCLNGIRLGLAGIEAGADLRTPVADRMYIVSSDGGSVVSDAVWQTQDIIKAAALLHNGTYSPRNHRFSFAFPGSLQGFAVCPYSSSPQTFVSVRNAPLPHTGEYALAVCCHGIGPGLTAMVSTPTFLEKGKVAANFSTIASPTLYETQTIWAELYYHHAQALEITPYVLYYDKEDQIHSLQGNTQHLVHGRQKLCWTIPSTGGMPIFRVGFSLSSPHRFDDSVFLCHLSWKGAPKAYALEGMLMTSIWNTTPSWLQTWASSARQFQADFNHTVCISHPEENGIATIGTADWENYEVRSRLMFSLHQSGGLALRCHGHRRYYSARFVNYERIQILMRRDDTKKILAEADFPYPEDVLYDVCFAALGNHLSLSVNNQLLLQATDDTFTQGGAGLIVDSGTMCANGFYVREREA